MKSIDGRLEALEKVVSTHGQNHMSQVVPYDLATGKPYVQPDPTAAGQIWIPAANKAEAEQIILCR